MDRIARVGPVGHLGPAGGGPGRAPYLAAYGGLPYAGVYTEDYVPYFIRHPPVYYSCPIAYPYGYSPYPRLPEGVGVVAQPAARPVVIQNVLLHGQRAGRGPGPGPGPGRAALGDQESLCPIAA